MPRKPAPLRFDARWNRKRQRQSLWRRWRWAVPAALAIVLFALFGQQPERRATEWETVTLPFHSCGDGGSGPCAIDGDTVAVGNRRVRLTGFDAPELKGACPQEESRAQAAKAALVVWLTSGPFEWDGGSDPPRDQYGRELRSARRGKELLADRMIDAGLASGSGWGASVIDWCAATY